MYMIAEPFIDMVEKKLNRIAKKCERYGNPFTYRRVGTEIKEKSVTMPDGRKVNMPVKFIVIEVDGRAEINGYEVIAVLEIHKAGNIIRRINKDIEIPKRFRTTENICEHCGSIRPRKELYIIRDTTTGEFKQVGSTCLMPYTGGISADYIAGWYDGLTELEAYDDYVDNTVRDNRFYKVEDVIGFATEITDKLGYFNSNAEVSTKSIVLELMRHEEMDKKLSNVNNQLRRAHYTVGIERSDVLKETTQNVVERIINYYKTLDDDSEFTANVKTILSEGYVSYKNMGYIVYLPAGYNKHINREIQQAKRRMIYKESKYYGEEKVRYKDKDISEASILTSYETVYGETYLYRFILAGGEILIWRTSKYIKGDDLTKISKITFTVKSHSEYSGGKQTEITRVKIA